MFHRLERIVQRERRPSQLPGAKITVPVLLVQVGEDEKHQQGDDPWNQHQTCGDAVHEVTPTSS